MPWRRRRPGRKRKAGAERKPSGQIRYEPTLPPDAVIEKRRALFGSEKAQAATDCLVDRAWAKGLIGDGDREAAKRFADLIRYRLKNIGAPRPALQAFNASSSGSSGSGAGLGDDEDLEHLAAISVLGDLDRERPGTRAQVIGFVYFDTPPQSWHLVRWALERLAAHFAEPKNHRLRRVGAPATRS